MKLNKQSLIFDVFTEKFRQHHLNASNEQYLNLSKTCSNYPQHKCLIDIKSFLYKNDFNERRNLILTKKSFDNLKSYKVPKEIRFDVLATLPNRCDAIQLTEKLCMFYYKHDNEICVRFHSLHEDKHSALYMINSFCFGINLELKSFFYDMADYDLYGNVSDIFTDGDFIEKYYSLFMICVTYLELTNVTFDICYSNSKRGHIMKGNDLKNELPFNVIQVNTNWNITKLHIGDTFQVKGHWRLQPCGTGRTNFKYVFINTYEKTGIIKKTAGKYL